MSDDNEIVYWCDECNLTDVCARYSLHGFCPKEGIGEDED